MDCVFCEKTKGNPNMVQWFEPLNPVTEGHMLFVPTVHVQDAGEHPEITAMVMEKVAEYVRHLDTDYNIITSSGSNATQTVFHLHIHVIPRRESDGLQLPWTNQHLRD